MQLKNNISFLMLFALIVLLGACGNPKTGSEIFGVYHADYKEAREELVIGSDFSFKQEVVLKATGRIDVARGGWRYDSGSGYITFDGGLMLVLDGFQMLDHDYYHPKSGLVSLPVVRLFGVITIGADEGVVYRKH